MLISLMCLSVIVIGLALIGALSLRALFERFQHG